MVSVPKVKKQHGLWRANVSCPLRWQTWVIQGHVLLVPLVQVPKTEAGAIKAMLAVEPTSRPLLNWLTTKLLSSSRGDILYLARVHSKNAEAQVGHSFSGFASFICQHPPNTLNF